MSQIIAAASIRRLLAAVSAAMHTRTVFVAHNALSLAVLGGLIVIACFCAICGKIILDLRSAAWTHAAQMADSLLVAVSADAERNIESFDLSLQGLIEKLHHPELKNLSPTLRHQILFDRSIAARHLDSMVVLDEKGFILLDSRAVNPQPTNRAERDYFQFHRDHFTTDLHISRPIIARSTGNHVVVLSRRLSHPDGSFAGVVAGSVRLTYFQQLFKSIISDPRDTMTLFRNDGIVLMRSPYQEDFVGRDLSRADLFKHYPTATAGRFETAAVTDGLPRLFAYRQIANLPLIVSIGRSLPAIYAEWRRSTVTIGLLVVLLCLAGLALTALLAREFRRRSEVVVSLATEASTDGLTGLSNRRCFDETLQREWSRAMRDRSALSVIMIDVDFFKQYNDERGHHAGDAVLKLVAAAASLAVRRGADLAARYGGDEFVVLLPGSTADGAQIVAKHIRSSFAELIKGGLLDVRLSMGIAAMIPQKGESAFDLVVQADKALYRAKELGRDRIELFSASTAGAVLSKNQAA